MKKIFYPVLILSILILNVNITNANTTKTSAAKAPVKVPAKTVTVNKTPAISYTKVSPVDVVSSPEKYLNKNITFDAEFVSFTSLGLDYKPAFRDSAKYIGILIRRPDIKDHTIPLSEMKILVTRELAEKNIDVDAGDTIRLSGNVFSNALGDPWMEAKEMSITANRPQ